MSTQYVYGDSLYMDYIMKKSLFTNLLDVLILELTYIHLKQD